MAITVANFQDFFLEVVRGNNSSFESIKKFGAINDLGASLTPVATAGVYRTPTALTSLEVVSSDAGDVDGGGGGTKIKVQGLSTGWTEITEEVTLNGQTAVPLSNQFYRVYRLWVSESDAYGDASTPSHLGTITLRVASAGDTWAQIDVEDSFGLGQSQIGAYTVPEGKIGYVYLNHLSIQTTKEVTLFFLFRENADDTSENYSGTIRVQRALRGLDSGSMPFGLDTPLGPYVGPCDLGFMGKTTTGSTADVSVDFSILLEDA